jgi:ATP-binding cassette, subfamily G (WHITE), member 2, PDR
MGEKIASHQCESEFGFARKVGYAQQIDIHHSTSTVREALQFSALLRQSEDYSHQEKMGYVDKVIELLEMESFIDAVIGVPGEGLNIEQRKKLTIGVELAARPELLLFLDEPTSGLDSDTAWSICTTLRRLADDGQSILCTIHQPSSELFQMFDQLLFLSSEGQQIYFGESGHNFRTVIDYFEQRKVRKCLPTENCAEWLFEVTGPNTSTDWSLMWTHSEEKARVDKQTKEVKKTLIQNSPKVNAKSSPADEYATGFLTQIAIVTRRNLLHDWRSPSYLYSKAFLTGLAVSRGQFSYATTSNSACRVFSMDFRFITQRTAFKASKINCSQSFFF